MFDWEKEVNDKQRKCWVCVLLLITEPHEKMCNKNVSVNSEVTSSKEMVLTGAVSVRLYLGATYVLIFCYFIQAFVSPAIGVCSFCLVLCATYWLMIWWLVPLLTHNSQHSNVFEYIWNWSIFDLYLRSKWPDWNENWRLEHFPQIHAFTSFNLKYFWFQINKKGISYLRDEKNHWNK